MSIKKLLGSLVTRPVWVTLHNYRVLSIEFGQLKSIRRRESVDKNGEPIPWYTYPAIEYIKQFDLSDKTLFEYGSGNSTLFWARRCKSVISIEDNERWYEKIHGAIPKNVDYQLVKDKTEYVQSINHYQLKFDLIAIDGSYRHECAQIARPRLRNSGFIILDNSDWREETSAFLRDSDLIEVDMSGFGPINPYTWTTSFYLTRAVQLKPAHGRQPIHSLGSQTQRQADQQS